MSIALLTKPYKWLNVIRSQQCIKTFLLDSYSTVHFDASGSEVEEIIEKSLDKSNKKSSISTNSILTTRRESLSLYREIMRITALFDWPDDKGQLWRDILRKSARQEFEAARYERDPEIVTRLLIVGRDSVHKVAERFLDKRKAIIPGNSTKNENTPMR